MARQRDSKLVGTIGNLIFYNHRGDYRMRTETRLCETDRRYDSKRIKFWKSQ